MEYQKLIKDLYDMTSIPLGLYEKKGAIAIYPSYAVLTQPVANMVVPLMDKGVVMEHLISNSFLSYGFIQIKGTAMYLVVGPVAEYDCNSIMVRKILEEFVLSSSVGMYELIDYFKKTPKVTASQFLRCMVFLHYVINHEDPPESFHYVSEESISTSKVESGSEHTFHNFQAVEQAVSSMVTYGKTHELKKMFRNHKQIDARIGITANDPIQNYKNIFVASVTLTSRDAIKGGMNYESAMTISDNYLKRLESLTSYNDIHNLLEEMLLNYAGHIEKIRKLNANSHLATKVSDYVLAHIYEKVSVATIANHFGLNCSYLSRRFKQDTGKPLSVYINEMKIGEACRLLRTTQASIIDIADTFGYSSQTYFQTVFKSVTGLTPITYRKENK